MDVRVLPILLTVLIYMASPEEAGTRSLNHMIMTYGQDFCKLAVWAAKAGVCLAVSRDLDTSGQFRCDI